MTSRGVFPAMTDSLTVKEDRFAGRATEDDEDIESELFFSTREAGVACFAASEPEAEGGATRTPG